jgi:transcriptional regulator with XRE-family HTH domain
VAKIPEIWRWTPAQGKRLREKRITKGLSQKTAAGLLGVTDDTLRNWENGTTQPREESLAALAEFFGVSLEELLAPEPVIHAPTAPAAIEEVVAQPAPGEIRRSLRIWLGVGIAVGIATLAALGMVFWRRSRTFSTLRPTPNGIEAISLTGNVLWRASGVDPKIAERWTLVRVRGGRTLIACVLAKPADYRPEIVSTLSLLEPNAERVEVVDRIVLPAPGGKLFPGYSRRYELAYLRAVDLDEDGIDEVVATFQQVPECVSYTILYEPVIGRARVLAVQTGAHHFTGAWDIDRDGQRDLLFLGINNGYNWVNTLAAVRVKPWIGERLTGDEAPVFSPDSAAYVSVESEALFYALLPRGRVPDDPTAVAWDAARRRISVKLLNGRDISLTPSGFLLPSQSTLSEANRSAFRREAYRHDRESRRLDHAGFAMDAVDESREAVLAAKRAGDEILTEAMQRDLAKALIGAGITNEAEDLIAVLATNSENASEIFYDAAAAFHVAGDLTRAIRFYDAGIRRGGSPEAGKSKHEFLQAEVFALVEVGQFAEAEHAIARFRDRYVTGDEDWTAMYGEFVRWRKGEPPRPERVAVPTNATDLMRYWVLEFRNARGDPTAALLRAADALLGEGNRPRGPLMSLRADLLSQLGRHAEALTVARAASVECEEEAKTSLIARGHLKVVRNRAAHLRAAD